MLDKCVAIDIESSGLLADMLDFSSFPYKLREDAKIWVISFTDISTMEVKSLELGEITKENIDNILKPYTYIVQHNGLKFDLLVLKLFGFIDYKIGWLTEEDTLNGRKVRFIDTLLLSRLLHPDKQGGHSLKALGSKIGEYKDDYRAKCVEAGIIDAKAPKGEEFRKYNYLMRPYCEQDTKVTAKIFLSLLPEYTSYSGWKQAFKQESKLADLAIRRESMGFWFDKELALKLLVDLSEKMEDARAKVNPLLPPKPMTKTELSSFTPPNTQFLKNGKPSSHIIKFAERVGGKVVENEDNKYFIEFENKLFELPFTLPLKTHIEADISNLDHVKATLIDLNWNPTEWRERDFTKDSKKQSISYEKRVTAFERWVRETNIEGKYKKNRLQIAFENFKVRTVEELEDKILEKLKEDFPVRLPTSPCVRVGVAKNLCPNLEKLGDTVEFAKDFALYLTYKHRKSSVAGGDIEDMDFDEENPNTGYLSTYREEDGRIPTPAIEIGASSNRYRHLSVSNIPRASSVYGKEMRSLFGCGEGFVQLGYDFSSLENRVQGGYVYKYEGGKELAEMLVAEKPNDLHSKNAKKLGITRDESKSFTYAILYGAFITKLANMLGISFEKAKELYESFWDSVPALKAFKADLEKQWKTTANKYIIALDGRKILTRSAHSILNFAFQSGGVISAKYVSIFLMEDLEKQGYCIDPFIGRPDVCSMIEYHDESQLAVNPKLVSFKVFETEDQAKEFVKEWRGEEQLSAISEGNKWYVTLPNVVSKAITDACKRTEELLSLDFNLGIEWIVNKNWYGCH